MERLRRLLAAVPPDSAPRIEQIRHVLYVYHYYSLYPELLEDAALCVSLRSQMKRFYAQIARHRERMEELPFLVREGVMTLEELIFRAKEMGELEHVEALMHAVEAQMLSSHSTSHIQSV